MAMHSSEARNWYPHKKCFFSSRNGYGVFAARHHRGFHGDPDTPWHRETAPRAHPVSVHRSELAVACPSVWGLIATSQHVPPCLQQTALRLTMGSSVPITTPLQHPCSLQHPAASTWDVCMTSNCLNKAFSLRKMRTGTTPGNLLALPQWEVGGIWHGAPSGELGLVLTGLAGDELRYGSGEWRAGVWGAHQLALGHLGVGLSKLQPQRLGDLRVEADALREGRGMVGWVNTSPAAKTTPRY